jgi:Mn2+/Fe2+ NRAMP family transporter
MGACLFYVCYVVSGLMAKPDWAAAARGSVTPRMEWDREHLAMIVGIIGTTIAPWMQFYQQASVVEKGIPLKLYKYSRLDTIVGAVVVTIVCYFIVIACAATLHREHVEIVTAADAARALKPIAGPYCAALFALGLLNASFFAATILPISTATSVCEAMGWESGVDRRFREAPQYYLTYTLVIAISALVALVADEKHLVPIMLISQVVNGVLLPVVVFFMLRICGDKTIMGPYANSRLFNVVSWAGAALVAALSLAMVVFTLIGS